VEEILASRTKVFPIRSRATSAARHVGAAAAILCSETSRRSTHLDPVYIAAETMTDRLRGSSFEPKSMIKMVG